MSKTPVFVLIRQRDDDDGAVAMGVYHTMDQVEARLENVRESNKQYKLRKLSNWMWRLGPTEDEGFFGNKPMTITVLNSFMYEKEDEDE